MAPQGSSISADAYPADRFVLDCRGLSLDCRPQELEGPGVHVMGILNVTPDSFSDGGQFTDVEEAISRVTEMRSEGASVIDVGGESTRPGADPVSPEEERDRVIPVVEALAEEFPETPLSVDTYKPAVAHAALNAGAHIINDVTGLRYDPDMAEVVADADAGLVLMHSKGQPGDLTSPREYADVTAEVRDSLADAIGTAEEAGVESIIVDPGFGFGKSHRENLRLINEIDELSILNRPVLIGVSRKSTIGATLGSPDNPPPPEERLAGSLGVTAVGVVRGASIVRTHDVAPTVEMLTLLNATLRSS